jgi:glycerol-3-phosphate dehydrogenase (NAD(P)+)
MDITVGIIGAGSFGLTISKLVSNNANVILYSRSAAKVASINATHKLRNIDLPDNLEATTDLKYLCDKCKLIIPVLPSASMRVLIRQLNTYLTPSHFIIHATKGLDYNEDLEITKDNVFTMSQVIAQETCVVRIGCISGPNLASEILADQPSATVVASEYDEVIEIGRKVLTGKKFFVFGSHRIYGIELAGALKNIFSIGSGLLAGLGVGKNLQAVMLTRGLQEMIKLGAALGTDSVPFLGTAGIGDLIATATSESSRNYTLGKLIAQGKTLEEAKIQLEEVAEGAHTLKVVKQLARSLNLNLPICEVIYHIVYNNYPLSRALDKLMYYPSTIDVEFLGKENS